MSHQPRPVELLDYSLREIPHMTERMTEQERNDTVLDLYVAAYNSAFIAEYVRVRYQENMSHEQALAVANQARSKVRRALQLQALPPLNI